MASLTALAEELLARAKKIDALLEEKKLPYTSFKEDSLESLPEDVQPLRFELLDLSHDIRQLARGARLAGLNIAYSWTDLVILRIVWHYKLASAVPVNGSATYDEISKASGLSTLLVLRTVRAAMSMNIFDEAEPGKVCHTAISRLMAEDPEYYNAIGLQVQDWAPASLKLIDAWEKYGPEIGEPDKSAFSLANNGRSLFTALAEEPERAHRFDLAMKYYAQDKDFQIESYIVEAFDWASLDKPGSRVVDLGGGYGHISQTLARHTKHITFVVSDLPHVVEEGQKILPADLKDRIVFEGHSFLEPQSADNPPAAFLISRCLHNWSDHHSSIILRALIPALQQGSKVLVWDAVLEEKPVKKLSERFNLQQDLIMATISNGRDRSVADFKHLMESSDKRFVFEGSTQPKGCKLSMLEATWHA